MPKESRSRPAYIGLFISVLAIAAVTLALASVRQHVNATTVAVIYLLAIVLSATAFESWVALAASVLAAASFNFFFLPPYFTLSIADPENWVSLFVFLAVAITVGQLSAKANKRAAESERLYKELGEAFEQASQAEGLKRSEKLKSALLDAVTHDFRTPLTSIKASVTMLINDNLYKTAEKTLDDSGRGELLEVINEETDRLNTFVESMVEVARLEAGDMHLSRTAVTPEEIIVKAARRTRAIKKTHDLKSQIEPNLPSVSADSRAIVEAVHNLLDNAAKYSPAGSMIFINAKRSGDFVRFSVEDEGTGIPATKREAVFERFYRSDKGSEKGLGMGLAIVRGIIEAHGGKIWVESGKKGTRFVFELPVAENGR